MKNFTRILGGLLASVIIFSTCSCSSRSSHIDPDTVPRVPQNTAIITPQDLVQAAQLAAASILQDKKMNNYLAEYKKQKGDPNAVPVLDCRIFNQMNNPDFVATPFLTTFESAVRDSKKYNLVRNSNSSIQGKKQKPDLIFSGTFYELVERKGRTRTVSLLYVFKINESKNNRLLWSLKNDKTNQYATRLISR